jgi:glycosyltransferase involved in cell wall biosynthesis
MRVLYLHAGNLYGGVESTAVTIARYRHLCPEMEPHFAVCFEGRLSRELAATGVSTTILGDVRIRHPWTVRRVRRALRELLRRERFDVVITHSAWGQALFGPVVKAAGLLLAYWFHEPMRGKHWLERWATLTRPDLALCNSKFTASSIHNMYPALDTEWLYNPVPPIKQLLSLSERVAIRSELKTPEAATVILQASRMEEWKGHLIHLKALSLLRDIPDWVCWQAGGAQRSHERKYLEKLKATALRLGIAERIYFLGERSDIPKIMAAADIHCQPNSGPEPFGNVFVEALFSQLPVVTTAMGGAKEIVDDTCGFLVPPDNVQAIATSLAQLIQKPALRISKGAAGPARARKLCDPETQLIDLKEKLSSLIKRKIG